MTNKTILSSILLSGLFFCTTSSGALHAAATEDAVVNTEKPDNHNRTPEEKQAHKEKRRAEMKGMTPEEKQAHKEKRRAHKEKRRAHKAANHKS